MLEGSKKLLKDVPRDGKVAQKCSKRPKSGSKALQETDKWLKGAPRCSCECSKVATRGHQAPRWALQGQARYGLKWCQGL